MERVEIFESGDKAFEFLGRIIEEKARLAISDRNIFVIGLSGKFIREFFFLRSSNFTKYLVCSTCWLYHNDR
jgi:hypothetical protein